MAALGHKKNGNVNTFALTVIFNSADAYKLLATDGHGLKVYISVQVNNNEQQLVLLKQSTLTSWANATKNNPAEKCGAWLNITGITTQKVTAKIYVDTHGIEALSDASVTNS